MKNPMKTEPVVTLAAGGIAGNGALHPILEAANMSATGHTLIHGAIVAGLALVARQKVYAPASVDKIKATKGAPHV